MTITEKLRIAVYDYQARYNCLPDELYVTQREANELVDILAPCKRKPNENYPVEGLSFLGIPLKEMEINS